MYIQQVPVPDTYWYGYDIYLGVRTYTAIQICESKSCTNAHYPTLIEDFSFILSIQGYELLINIENATDPSI